MQAKVKLSEIGEFMDMQSEDMNAWLNRQTGTIEMLNSEILRALEDGDDPQDAVDMYGGNEQDIEIAREIAKTHKWVALPDKFEIHDYKIMENFCYSKENSDLQNRLLNAIRGSGAFRRFRQAVEQAGILNKCYEFKNAAYLEIAKEWCESNEVECE